MRFDLFYPALIFIVLSTTLGGCQRVEGAQHGQIPDVTAARGEHLDSIFLDLLEQHGLITLGAAVIRDGEVVWTGYYGEQSPGVPASAATQFNVASITKTVTAETILRLVGQDRMTLDESMATEWVDPDIAEDSRHTLLTARMALTHRTGFLNWRFFAGDGVLRFVNDPGTTYGYSGEGFEYLARFAERRTDNAFDQLVEELVFAPYGITGASFTVREANFENIARPEDEAGVFLGHYCRPRASSCPSEGRYSAADDMVITVEDYARFLISVMDGRGYEDELENARDSVQTLKEGEDAIACSPEAGHRCPVAQGYGLGWEILDFGDTQLIGHGGSDWAEVATAYFYTASRDGLVIFINAPNVRGHTAMPDAIEAIDPGSVWAIGYRAMRDRALQESQ